MLCVVQTETASAFERWRHGNAIFLVCGEIGVDSRYLGGRHRINLKGNGRIEKWQIYHYGDKSMAVKHQEVEVSSRGIGDVGVDLSPNLGSRCKSVFDGRGLH